MYEPFSHRAKPWEYHAQALRRLADLTDGGLLDPWKLAPKVGLIVFDGEAALKLLPETERDHLRGSASRSWSGGILPIELPDGSKVCILNPHHQPRRNKITLMEEITHSFLKHTPTRVTLHADTLQVRDFEGAKEAEAYGVGAAALVPWDQMFPMVNEGADICAIAERFDVSDELAAYRIKITGAYRLFQARQRRTA